MIGVARSVRRFEPSLLVVIFRETPNPGKKMRRGPATLIFDLDPAARHAGTRLNPRRGKIARGAGKADQALCTRHLLGMPACAD